MDETMKYAWKIKNSRNNKIRTKTIQKRNERRNRARNKKNIHTCFRSAFVGEHHKGNGPPRFGSVRDGHRAPISVRAFARVARRERPQPLSVVRLALQIRATHIKH